MSLTDDWKAGKLNEKSIWWADLGNEKIEPARVDEYGYLFGLDGCFYSPESCEYVKILAPCDYDHFVELTEKVKGLEKDVENLTNNYKLLESKQAIDIADGQALVDEFGDFESVYEELQRLREESKQMFDLLEVVARGITLDCDTEDVIRITSAVKRFCISKRESEGK